jgi:hypothetical protein
MSVPRSKFGLSIIAATSGCPACRLFYCFQSSYNVRIHIYIRILEKISLTSLHPRASNRTELGSLDIG